MHTASHSAPHLATYLLSELKEDASLPAICSTSYAVVQINTELFKKNLCIANQSS